VQKLLVRFPAYAYEKRALDAIKLHLPEAGATFGSPFMIPPNAP